MCYAVDFGGTNLRAVRVALDGRGGCTRTQHRVNIRSVESSSMFPKGLLDKRATATLLFDTIALAVKQLMENQVGCSRFVIFCCGYMACCDGREVHALLFQRSSRVKRLVSKFELHFVLE